ncbi:hypothetical protein KIN20_023733 [Parelaphostrongylus tenuis]|uniref:Uncharacterized protein n=1 Tax=Parelaphostrongylus tenuis TaxID=148309 RepID=A0AAD5MS68_PARTN|nr:hypothetical protein KIN20_023733 [Parelaphostrongylus tenuis]
MDHHASLHHKIRDFENRIRKWRQLRFGFVDSVHLIAPRRSASSDPKRFVGEFCPQIHRFESLSAII